MHPNDVAVHSAAGPVLVVLYTILDELRQYGQHSRKEKVKLTIYKGDEDFQAHPDWMFSQTLLCIYKVVLSHLLPQTITRQYINL